MTSILSSLLEQSTINDHEEVVKACNAALKESRSNIRTQHVKAVALLHLNRFDDVIRLFEEGGERLRGEAQLEYAYALYKTGDLEKAEQVAGEIDSRGAKHLEGQASYRLENFANAEAIYHKLLEKPQEEENDVRINLGATSAQLLWKQEGSLKTKRKAEREDLEAFETAYNAACISIAQGELVQARILLKQARALCEAHEELTSEQKQEELLPISVQQVYVLNLLGEHEEAQSISTDISIDKIPDLSTRQIAQANKLASTIGDVNPYITQRLLSSTTTLTRSDKLFNFQKLAMERNRMAADLASSKFAGIARSTEKYLKTHSPPSISPRVNGVSCANAAAHARNQLGKLGLKTILPLLGKRPKDIGLVATIVQIYLLTHNQGAAIQIVEKLLRHLDQSNSAAEQEVRYNPGLVAMIVSLYSLEGRKSHIRTELAKAASYWKHRSKASPGLLRSAGLSLLGSTSNEDLKVAGEIFEELRKANPNDRYARAGWVASFATFDPSSASADSESLTAIERLTAGIDVAALEKVGIPPAGTSAASTLLKRKRVDAPLSKPKKKRVRKSKLPKDFDPNKKPDPERWLPLRDRSTYKPKGKKGKQKQATLTQGSSEKAPEIAGAEQARSTVVTASSGGGKSKKKNKKK